MTTVTKRVPPGAAGGATLRITGVITQDITKRVVGAITASTTVRVPDVIIPIGPFLLLEGDSSGGLSLESTINPDLDPHGFLKLEGV